MLYYLIIILCFISGFNFANSFISSHCMSLSHYILTIYNIVFFPHRVVTSELTFYFNHLDSLGLNGLVTQEQFTQGLWPPRWIFSFSFFKSWLIFPPSILPSLVFRHPPAFTLRCSFYSFHFCIFPHFHSLLLFSRSYSVTLLAFFPFFSSCLSFSFSSSWSSSLFQSSRRTRSAKISCNPTS